MIVAGFDLETEWRDPVDPTKIHIWETAIVLWDTNTNIPILFEHDLIWASNYLYDARMKISRDHLETYGTWPVNALDRIRKLFELSDAVVAHNGKDFDKIVLEEEFKRHGMGAPPEKLWIDTTVDVPYPPNIETRKLEFLGPVHGFLNPYSHRALFDVCSMLKIASVYDWNVIFERAKTPDLYIVAEVKKPWEDSSRSVDQAKLRGYRFDKDSKYWYKKIKTTELDLERQQAPFRVGLWNQKNKEIK